MLMAVVAAEGSVVTYGFSNSGMALRATVGPVFTTTFADLVCPSWGVLGAPLIRKAGAGFITIEVASFPSMILGGAVKDYPLRLLRL